MSCSEIGGIALMLPFLALMFCHWLGWDVVEHDPDQE